MAVEIPVVVDIMGGIDDSIKQVPQAVKKLQAEVDLYPIETSIRIGVADANETNDELKKLTDYFRELEKADMERVGKDLDFTPFINQSIMQLQKLEKELDEIQQLRQLEGGGTDFARELADAHKAVRDQAEAVARSIAAMEQMQQNLKANGVTIKSYIDAEYAAIEKRRSQNRAYWGELEDYSQKYASSINAIQNRMSELERTWANMTKAERSDSISEMLGKYKKEAAELRTEARTLREIVQEQEKLNERVKQSTQNRRYENAVLKMSGDSMRILQEQERILSSRLNKAKFGSSQYDKLKTDLDGVRKKMQEVESSARNANKEFEKQSSFLGRLAATAASYFSIHTIVRFLDNVRNVTSEFELQKVALGSIIQDTDRADKLFRQIKAAAVESPFEIKDLVTYTKQLSAYRIETESLFDVTMRLADVSAGLGVDMSRLILAYGQVRAASVLRGQELRQFTEAGIPLVELLAEKFNELGREGTTTADVFELISKRAVPFSMIEKIFKDMTDAGGMFYKMQEKQAETLRGQWNNLKDSISIMYDEIGRTKKVHKAMSDLISLSRDMMLNWRKFADVIKVVGTAFLSYISISGSVALWNKIVTATTAAATAAESTREAGLRKVITRLIGKTAAEKISTRATIIHTAAMKAADAASTAFTRTLWKLIAVLAKNPFGVIAIAAAALIGTFTTLAKRAQDVEQRIDGANRSINNLSKARGNDDLIKRYEELSAKTNRSAKDTAALRDISKELAKAFPQATKAINAQTGALELDIKKMKEYSAQAQKTIKDLMEDQIKVNEAEIKKYEKKQSHIQKVLARGYGFVEGSYFFNLSKDAKAAEILNDKLLGVSDAARNLTETNQELRDSINGVKKETEDDNLVWSPEDDKAGDRLKKLRDQISDITNAYKKYIELRDYMSRENAKKNIETFFPSLKGLEPTFQNVYNYFQDLLKKYSSDADATRLIEQAFANIQFDRVKKSIEDSIKKITNEVKRSEAARNFYHEILGLTGDQELSATITANIYGDAGSEFKDRIQKVLGEAFESFDVEDYDLWDKMRIAIEKQDFKFILANIDKFGSSWRSTLIDVANDSQKFNADFVQDMLKTYQKTKTFEERITEIRQREAQNRKKIEESTTIPVAEKEKLINASKTKEGEDVAEVQVEALKATDEWITAFENLDKVGTRTLEKLILMLEELINTGGKDMNAGTLRSLTKSLEQAKEQVYARKPFEGFTSGAKSYVASLKSAVSARKQLKEQGDTPEVQKKLANAENQRTKALEKMKSSVDGLAGTFSDIGSIISGITEMVNLDDLSDGQAILSGIAQGIALIGSALAIVNGVLTLMEANPVVLTITAAVAAAVSLAKVISNLKVNRANREIEAQSKLIETLDYQYQRLEKSIAKAFGSDYVSDYNKQLETLAAKQQAYLAQAEAERSKGKKADEDKIKEYQNSARDVADQISEMQTQLSEFFSGTDVTSAAKDFASAWIDAYKEFGSTTDAMKEKFQDMIQEMVQNSLAAQVMKQLLQPIFDQIDAMAQEGGELSLSEVAQIAKMASDAIPGINDAMTTLMNTLAASGYNIRQQAGQFTGIARNIAGASEESIVGLAAGINTQNYYMSYVPMIHAEVQAIRAALTGETDVAAVSAGSNANTEAMLQYMQFVPTISDNVAEIMRMMRSVISTKGTTTATHHVAVAL